MTINLKLDIAEIKKLIINHYEKGLCLKKHKGGSLAWEGYCSKADKVTRPHG